MSRITRRNFLKSTSAVAGTSLILTGTQASGKVKGANDRLLGLTGRGFLYRHDGQKPTTGDVWNMDRFDVWKISL